MLTSVADTPTAELDVKEIIEHAKRAFALKNFEKAVDCYATALELTTTQYGEDAPEAVDLYFLYGKALLENAVSQASVLGKDQVEEELESRENHASGCVNRNDSILSFSGDAEDGELKDKDVDVLAEAEGEDDELEEVDDAEPEDDFNAAWEVLDLARAIYSKQTEKDNSDEVKLKLADTYIALGDVSLETEKFDQAITDYSAGLDLKTTLLPLSSRQIAEAHYKLSMVLDLTSGRLSDAITHVEMALESVETRLAELRDGLNRHIGAGVREDAKKDPKGKMKASNVPLVEDSSVRDMTIAQMESELRELEGLKEDLALKIEELKTTPREPAQSAPALAAQALDQELNGSISLSMPNRDIINDLTSMVVKKKKCPEANETAKRKADHDTNGQMSDKKAKLES